MVAAMKIIQLHSQDNVVVALEAIEPGLAIAVNGIEVKAREAIAPGHKIAVREIRRGEAVLRYGQTVGEATADIARGDWVHSHNLVTKLKDILSYEYRPVQAELARIADQRGFQGFRRPNGEVGVRNHIFIVPMVSCINQQAEIIKREAESQIQGSVDRILVLRHHYGCSQLGDDHETTKAILADLVKHPNAGGVLVVGLGCENNKMSEFKKLLEGVPAEKVRFLVAQESVDEVEEGTRLIRELIGYAAGFKRQEIPLSELRLGMKCGGSDGLSGVTANPLVGAVADEVVRRGGSAVLTETPEMFGAETILMNRARNREVFEAIVRMINEFKEYYISHNQPIYENPAPGNIDGGITTLEEKSLGAIEKGGTGPVDDVLKYGERLRKRGLTLLSAPGNDAISITALGAAGCHMLLFTTGRGTPLGTFIPTIKISSSHDLFARKKRWIDFDGARVLEQGAQAVAQEVLEQVIAVASGRKTWNEENQAEEIAIFKDGVTL